MTETPEAKHVGMTEKEIQEYLGAIASDPDFVLESPFEEQAAGELRHAFAEKSRLEQAIAQHEQAAMQARAILQQQAGAIGALSTILYKAEGIRRLQRLKPKRCANKSKRKPPARPAPSCLPPKPTGRSHGQSFDDDADSNRVR